MFYSRTVLSYMGVHSLQHVYWGVVYNLVYWKKFKTKMKLTWFLCYFLYFVILPYWKNRGIIKFSSEYGPSIKKKETKKLKVCAYQRHFQLDNQSVSYLNKFQILKAQFFHIFRNREILLHVLINTKLAGLFTLWIDKEKHVCR